MRKAFLQLCALIIFIFAFGFIFQTTQAIVETEWPAGKANVCKNSGDGFVSFEGGADEASISSTVPGMKFTTTGGLDWKYSDIRTGNYSVYPYGHQGYETNGNFFAWLGTTGGKGRIDFTEEEATYFSCLVSTASGLVLDAYDSDDTLVATSGWAESNVNTRTFTRLTVEAPGGIAYIIVHDTGNYWLIDDICTDISPEYELDVPYFNQCDDPWKELSYNHITGTICNWGCALTSSTMILNYYGEPYGLQTDPEKLNEWLNHRFWDLNGNGKLDPDEPTGYTRYGDINWKLVAEYFNDVYGEGVVSYNGRGDFNKNKETYITFRENSDSILNSDLSSQRPVILKAPYAPWHFVVATGKINIDNNSTWAINDPGWRSKENLLSYDNEYFGIRRYKPREEDNSAITIKAYSPVEIYTIDSQGRYLGKDPNAGEEFDEIPNGGYYTDTSMINGLKIKTIEVLKPIDGNYTIKVIGTDTGSYDIDYYSYDRSGYWSNFKTFTAEITSGEIHNYEVNYSSDIINRPPIANAEIQAEIQPKPLIEEPDDNYIIEANTFNGANITLDGTASYDPESASLTYSWSDEDGNILGTDEILNVFLPLGQHQITLTVSDGRLSSSDVLDITVQDTILPEVEITSPEEIIYLNTQGSILIAYTIKVIGTDTGSYDIDYYSYDRSGYW
ncbi:MAG: C39 family peptidase, partial [Actinobacteria bacterium]|nr:C39 family peptidase [Actinomycetota bacterium]